MVVCVLSRKDSSKCFFKNVKCVGYIGGAKFCVVTFDTIHFFLLSEFSFYVVEE